MLDEKDKQYLQDKIEEVFKASAGDTVEQIKTWFKDSQAANRPEILDLERREAEMAAGLKNPAKIHRANQATRIIRCMMAGKYEPDAAIKAARDMGDPDFVKMIEANFDHAKALGTTTIGGGGALIIPDQAGDLVDFLRNSTVVMESGARTLDMPAGEAFFGRVSSGAIAAYRGESVNATFSVPSLEQVTPRARILDVIGSMSNQFVRRSSVSADEFLRDDLSAATKLKMDQVLLRSVGTVNQPKGMLFWAPAANKFNATNVAASADGSTISEIISDLGTSIRLLRDGNIRMVRPGWIWSNRTTQKLSTVRDNGFWVFRDEMNGGKLFGIPFKDSASVPDNLGGGTDESEVYLADFFDLVLYQTMGLSVRQSTEAAYDPGSGLVSAFQRDETVVQVTMEHDFIARRNGTEIVVVQAIRWGA